MSGENLSYTRIITTDNSSLLEKKQKVTLFVYFKQLLHKLTENQTWVHNIFLKIDFLYTQLEDSITKIKTR